ncbi:MAG: tetratricopeptide repeat protein [Planctomycetales bacterium]|nr:tetratricopeptide repeat protein [Planctomycetales bacterium]
MIAWLLVCVLSGWCRPTLADAEVGETGASDTPTAVAASVRVESLRAETSALLESALIASGVEDAQHRAACLTQFARIAASLKSQRGDTVRSPEEVAADVHRHLHATLLTGQYVAECSEVERVFDEGVYNCVSATVVFHALCTELDLHRVAVARRTHVFSRLPESDLDVETTCAEWFDVPVAERPHVEADEREISDRALIGKIYFNRGVALLEQRDFAAAIELIRTSLLWDAHDPSARENLLAGLNNWALAECDARQFASAARLIDEGLAIDATYQPLLANDLHVRQRWVVDLCDHGRFAAARDVLQAGFRRRPDAELFDNGRLAVYRLWAKWLIHRGQLREGFAVFDEARRIVGERPDVEACESVTLREAARELQEAGRHQEASQVVAWSHRAPQNDSSGSVRRLAPRGT